ncbi:MAG: hypothetical protein K2M39_04130 [Muribaculaceae bacterium]|nr:hypothetical protein [Muribaculaceae bacterium]
MSARESLSARDKAASAASFGGFGFGHIREYAPSTSPPKETTSTTF